jgi:hypothetical protein
MADDFLKVDLQLSPGLEELAKDPDGVAKQMVSDTFKEFSQQARPYGVSQIQKFTPVLTGALISSYQSEVSYVAPLLTITWWTEVVYGGVVETGADRNGKPMRKDGGRHMFQQGIEGSEDRFEEMLENATQHNIIDRLERTS